MAHTEEEIHGFKVKYDAESRTLRHAIEHLSKLDKSEAKVYFEDAKRDRQNHTAHFEVRDHERRRDNNLTLVHEDDGSYHLRKREHHTF